MRKAPTRDNVQSVRFNYLELEEIDASRTAAGIKGRGTYIRLAALDRARLRMRVDPKLLPRNTRQLKRLMLRVEKHLHAVMLQLGAQGSDDEVMEAVAQLRNDLSVFQREFFPNLMSANDDELDDQP